MSSLILLAVAPLVVLSLPEQTDVGWELTCTNSKGPVSRTCFDAPGLPPSISGTYFLAGPAKFDGLPEGQWKYKALFDGLGMVNRFEILPKDKAKSSVCYTSVWLGSHMYEDFTKDPTQPPRGLIFEDTIPSRSNCTLYMCDYLAPNDNNWINMLPVGDKALWLSDTPVMVSMDPETMSTSGWKTWKNDKTSMGKSLPEWVREEHLTAGGSAHPLLRPGTQEVVELLVEMPLVLGNWYLSLYTFDASVVGPQDRVKMVSLKISGAQYFHSFGLTPNYVVLPFNLKNINLGPGHVPFLLGKFEKAWNGIHIVDLKGNDHVFSDVDPFFHVHIANTYENASGVVMDLATYQEIPFERMAAMDIKTHLNKTARDNSQPRGQMRRMYFDFQTNKTTVQKLTDNVRDYDFAKTNPNYAGLPYCIYYAVEWYHDDKAFASMAIVKHDICMGKTMYWSEPNVYLNEPFFIPSGTLEEDGTLIFTANDGSKGKAIFVALDAKTFKEIERIELPFHIPFTAHGSFIPRKAEATIVV